MPAAYHVWELTATLMSLKQACLHIPVLSVEAGNDMGVGDWQVTTWVSVTGR